MTVSDAQKRAKKNYESRQKELGMVTVKVLVPQKDAKKLKSLAATMRESVKKAKK